MATIAAPVRPIAVQPEPIARRIAGTAVERPRDAPPDGVPIALRSAQHSFISRGRFEPPWSKRTVIAKWLIAGEAAMEVEGQRLTIKPDQVAIYIPTIPHRFWAVAESNEMCWFSIDGPLAEPFVLDLRVQPGVYHYGPPPIERIHQLMDALRDHSLQGRRAASLLAINQWYQLANIIHQAEVPSLVHQVRHMIQQEFANPDLSTKLIASTVGYHRGSLSRLFHQSTGVTLMEYITQVRLQQARTLLVQTDESVSEIARKCGFRETSYFCRWLRKHTGTTPGSMRQVSNL